MTAADSAPAPWQDELFALLQEAGVRQVAYVPDAGHARLIRHVHADATMRGIVLTTEEEGVAVACGAWLGGQRAVLLMQSSGVGNCINMLSLVENGRFPFLCIVTMRGEWAEFNPWQVPMAKATRTCLEAMGVRVLRAEHAGEVAPTVRAALDAAFGAGESVAVLLGQRLIGAKQWEVSQ